MHIYHEAVNHESAVVRSGVDCLSMESFKAGRHVLAELSP